MAELRTVRRRERARSAGPAAIFAAGLAGTAATGARAGDFASLVHSYVPAPGQNINSPFFGDPTRALGAPVGGGTGAADNSKVVTLGGFGGSITLGFDAPVEDSPCNPHGMDAIVFGNAFWVNGNPNRRWAEAAVIEISADVNGNGLPDDPWYVVKGSSLPAAPQGVWREQAWDNAPGTPTPPVNVAWYPMAPQFPAWPSGYATGAFELPAPFRASVLVNPNGLGATVEGHFGYADVSPVMLLGDMSGATGGTGENLLSDPEDRPGVDPAEFYTVPDDPRAVGVSPGSGGGDAFDIQWAVHPATGEPAGLTHFHFIRISTAVDVVSPSLGETSTEIAAVADVRRARRSPGDANLDGVVDFADLNAALSQFNTFGEGLSADFDCNGVVDFGDLNAVLSNWGAGT
ncbi:MAG: hypothetical protein IBJ10_01475 [Phycisphaerales bacterium]|nr:hypothetical protein [Phycisphaerales bacterium]